MITGMPRIAIATTDFDGLVFACRQTLGLPLIDLTDDGLEPLGARLTLCVPAGGRHIESMGPAVATTPLSPSGTRLPMQKACTRWACRPTAPRLAPFGALFHLELATRRGGP